MVCSFERKGCGSTLGQQELAKAGTVAAQLARQTVARAQQARHRHTAVADWQRQAEVKHALGFLLPQVAPLLAARRMISRADLALILRELELIFLLILTAPPVLAANTDCTSRISS